MIKTPAGTTHVLAVCRDCPWTDDNYVSAENTARVHALKTGHTVGVERTQTYTFNPKNPA